MFKAKGNPRVLIGDVITAKDAVDPADGTATVSLSMNESDVVIDFTGLWNTAGYGWADVTIGDYCVAWQTDAFGNIIPAVWMYMPKAVFEDRYVIDGA